jgi:hypothetical protein
LYVKKNNKNKKRPPLLERGGYIGTLRLTMAGETLSNPM